MVLENILADGAAHFGAGIALSFLDYVTARIANPKEKRIAEKTECSRSIENILDATQQSIGASEVSAESNEIQNVAVNPDIQPDSMQYAQNIAAVRDYFRTNGLVKFKLPVWEKFKDGCRNLIYHEKINNLSNTGKLGVAVGLEVLYDTLFGFRYYTQVLKKSPIAAIATNIYQIPLFFSGLWIGSKLIKPVSWILTSSDEKKLDKTINALLKETPIIDIVVKYKPPVQVQDQLAAEGIRMYGSKLTRAGKSIYEKVQLVTGTIADGASQALDTVAHYGERKKEEQEKERNGRKQRFGDITKNR